MPPRAIRAAAQVDPLHVVRVDVDLELGRRLRHRRHVGRAQLERGRAAVLLVGVRPQRRVDRPELVAQDAVVVDRRDLLEVGEDLVAQRALGGLVGLEVRVEPQLEVAHELGGDRGVRRQHVVLVALGEARADPLAVLAVGAQDRHLRAVEPGGDHQPVQRVGLRRRRGRRPRSPRPRARRRRRASSGCSPGPSTRNSCTHIPSSPSRRVEISSITRSPRSSSIGIARESSILASRL